MRGCLGKISFSIIRTTPAWGAGYHGRIETVETALIAIASMLWGTAFMGSHQPADAETSAAQPSSRSAAAWHLALVLFALGGASLSCAGICLRARFPTPDPAAGEIAAFLIRLICGALLAGAAAVTRRSGRFALSPITATLVGEAAVMLGSYLVERHLVPLMASSSGSILVSLLVPILCCAGATFAAWRSHAIVSRTTENELDSLNVLLSLPGADNLSQREIDVTGHALAGQTQKQIAALLGIAPATVATYRSRAYRKLGVASKEELGARLQPYADQGHDLGADACAEVRHPSAIDIQRNCGRVFLLPPLLAYLAAAMLLSAFHQPYRMTLVIGACLLFAVFALARASKATSSAAPDDSKRRTVCQLLAVAATLGWTGFLISSANPFDRNAGEQITLIALCTLGALMLADRVLTLRQLADSERRSGTSRERYSERMRHILAGKGFNTPSIDIVMESLKGAPVAAIAKRQHLSPSSVAALRSHVYSALGVSGITELNSYLLQEIGVKDNETTTG